MKMLSLSKTARILATLMCIISIVTSVIFFPVTGISAAEDIPGTDGGDVSTVSDIPGTDTMDEFTPVFTLAHARGSVKVTNSALKKATADIKIKIGTSKLSKKAFSVKARIDKEKTELMYIPVKAVVKKLGGIYKKSGNKVTVKYEVGSLSSEVTFKIGKDNYSLISVDQDNDISAAASNLSFGKSCLIGGTVYAPIESIASLMDNTIWNGLMACDIQKKSIRISCFPAPTQKEVISGGWGSVSSPEITPKLNALFDKAIESYTGVKLTPVAYIAMQVVGGYNHRFICRKKPVIAPSLKAVETYALVEIYEDLSGNAEITSVTDTNIETNINGLMGGWNQFDYSTVDMSQYKVVYGHLDTLSEGKYVPAAILSTQIVAGINVCFLCTRITETGSTGYSIVYIYVAPNWTSAEITDSIDF